MSESSDSPVIPSSSEVGAEPDPWFTRRREVPSHSPHFLELVNAARAVQDSITGSNPPDDVVLAAVRLLEDVRALLDPWQVPERDAPAGKLRDAPGRAQPVLLPFEIDEETSDSVRGRVRFSRAHLGGNGAAHGGTVPLLFDEVLGRLANSAGRQVARTAYLKVDYRNVTPIDVDLEIEAHVNSEHGRKRLVTGSLRQDDQVLAEAEGLFVILRPGQP